MAALFEKDHTGNAISILPGTPAARSPDALTTPTCGRCRDQTGLAFTLQRLKKPTPNAKALRPERKATPLDTEGKRVNQSRCPQSKLGLSPRATILQANEVPQLNRRRDAYPQAHRASHPVAVDNAAAAAAGCGPFGTVAHINRNNES